MALTTPPAKPTPSPRASFFWSRLHFLIRLVGLTGLLALCAGLVLAGLGHALDSWASARAALGGAFGGGPPGDGAYLFLGGLLAVLIALAVEGIVIARLVAGRRSALGANAVGQLAVAVVLLAGVNVYSFRHALRFDWTRDRQFTLSEDVRADLAKLTDETTIVVYQMHRSDARVTDKPDRYDLAAMRKVVEKVKDLAELLREEGQRLKVVVLDVEDDNYKDNLNRLTADVPELRRAIESAPENSIFFHGQGRLQQMSFNDFYRLNKTQARAASNLVLRYAGIRPVVDRILNLEERRPRVGLIVFHEALGSTGSLDLFTLRGARKALEAQGFEVRDIISRRRDPRDPEGRLEPAADAREDSRLDRLLRRKEKLQDEITKRSAEIEALDEMIKELPTGPLEPLSARILRYLERFHPELVIERPQEDNREPLKEFFRNQRVSVEALLKRKHTALTRTEKELTTLNADQIGERQRLSDLHAKLSRMLADCDLLIIPRMTILPEGFSIPPGLHDLNEAQALAVKDFLRSGKPVLACFGPVNLPAAGPPRPLKPADGVEKLLEELGVHFGKRTVLFDADTDWFSAKQDRPDPLESAGEPLELPPLRLEPLDEGSLERMLAARFAAAKEPLAVLGAAAAGPLHVLPFLRAAPAPNPLRESLRLTDQDLGGTLKLRARFPRPVRLSPLLAHRLPFQAELLATDSEAWNDDQPFASVLRPVPSYVPPKPDDPDNRTPEARRYGSFTIGVAFETSIPPSWLDDPKDAPPRVRVVALGQGGLFTGTQLEPANEKLLVDACNWLVGRDDRLARAGQEFRYPRVDLSPRSRALWLWGTCLGLPVLFFYLGLVVLLARRLR